MRSYTNGSSQVAIAGIKFAPTTCSFLTPARHNHSVRVTCVVTQLLSFRSRSGVLKVPGLDPFVYFPHLWMLKDFDHQYMVEDFVHQCIWWSIFTANILWRIFTTSALCLLIQVQAKTMCRSASCKCKHMVCNKQVKQGEDDWVARKWQQFLGTISYPQTNYHCQQSTNC